MRILILGGTGYLGRRVANKLNELGHDVCCLIRFEYDEPVLKLLNESIEMCELSNLENLLQNSKFDCCLNMACMYQCDFPHVVCVYEANYFVPLQVFLKCMNAGINNFYTIGSALKKEINEYAFSKEQFAETLQWYVDTKGINVCNIKPEMYYGENEPINRFIPSVVAKLKKNESIKLTIGTQRRDVIYIDDLVDCIIRIIEYVPAGYNDIPLGTGEGPTIREIIEQLKRYVGSESVLEFGAIPMRNGEADSIADTTKMLNMGCKQPLGWKDGIKRII